MQADSTELQKTQRTQSPFKVNYNNYKRNNLCAIQSGIPESGSCENSENVNPEMMTCILCGPL